MGYIITERKFFNQLKNGEDFSSNTGTFDSFFRYNAAEYCKAVYKVRFSWESEASWAGRTEAVTEQERQACATGAPWEVDEPTPLTRQWLVENGYINE